MWFFTMAAFSLNEIVFNWLLFFNSIMIYDGILFA